jgi:hypothetical protein|nr:MAG TPA: hypothetical protein [Caudoviricetes sp.]
MENTLNNSGKEENMRFLQLWIAYFWLFVNSWGTKNIKLRQRVQIKNPLIIFDEKKCGEYGYGIF